MIVVGNGASDKTWLVQGPEAPSATLVRVRRKMHDTFRKYRQHHGSSGVLVRGHAGNLQVGLGHGPQPNIWILLGYTPCVNSIHIHGRHDGYMTEVVRFRPVHAEPVAQAEMSRREVHLERSSDTETLLETFENSQPSFKEGGVISAMALNSERSLGFGK